MAVCRADSTPVLSIGELVTYWVHEKIDVIALDGIGEEKRFNLVQPGPVIINGEPILRLGSIPPEPQTVRRITRFEIDGDRDAPQA